MFAHWVIYRESCVNGNEKRMASGQVEEIQLFHRFHLTGEIPENIETPKVIICLMSRATITVTEVEKNWQFCQTHATFPPSITKYGGWITTPINRWSVSKLYVHSL